MNESSGSAAAVTRVAFGVESADETASRRERALVRAAKKGSPDALEELARMFWPDANRIAIVVVADSAAAEDVAQEGLLAALRSLDRFDRRRPFRPWLYRIVTNQALDWVRARERRGEVALDPHALGLAGVEPDRDPGVSDEVMTALRSLAPRERAVVVLRHLLGLNSREIAGIMGVPDGTVRSMLQRALARLRRALEEDPDV